MVETNDQIYAAAHTCSGTKGELMQTDLLQSAVQLLHTIPTIYSSVSYASYYTRFQLLKAQSLYQLLHKVPTIQGSVSYAIYYTRFQLFRAQSHKPVIRQGSIYLGNSQLKLLHTITQSNHIQFSQLSGIPVFISSV